MEPFTTSTTVTGPVRECLQAGTENAPVLDRPAPLRRLHDSGAGYKYTDLLTVMQYRIQHRRHTVYIKKLGLIVEYSSWSITNDAACRTVFS